MRYALVNENPYLAKADRKYAIRITGDILVGASASSSDDANIVHLQPRLSLDEIRPRLLNYKAYRIEMDLKRKINASPDVVYRLLGDESVLLHLSDGEYFGLDAVGTRIWQLIAEHGEIHAVFEQMIREYEVEPRRLEDDLENYIGDLLDARLVIIESSEAR